jgi:hypothetical protein
LLNAKRLLFKKLIDILFKKPQYLVASSVKPHFIGFTLHKGPQFKGNQCSRRNSDASEEKSKKEKEIMLGEAS